MISLNSVTTRKHSSRMRTARLLTLWVCVQGCCVQGGVFRVCVSGVVCVCPGCVSWGGMSREVVCVQGVCKRPGPRGTPPAP